MSKSSVLTITKSVYPVQVLSLIGVLFETPKTGKSTELKAFIFLASQCQGIFKGFASVFVIEMWVALESTIAFLADYSRPWHT